MLQRITSSFVSKDCTPQNILGIEITRRINSGGNYAIRFFRPIGNIGIASGKYILQRV
jgi:hypothetical protein